MKLIHCLAFAIVALSRSMIQGEDAANTQQPAAKFNPPAVISLRLPDGKPTYRQLPGYERFELEFCHDVSSKEKTGRLRVFSLARGIGSPENPGGRARWIMDWYEVAPGELVPIAGSLYRWDQAKWELHRVDSGTIAVEKLFDRAILTSSIRFGSAKDRLQLDKIRFGEPVGEKEADSVDVWIFGKGFRIGERRVNENEGIGPFKLKRGDIVATAEWQVEVARILRPNPETKHPGWVELAVTHRRAE